MMADSQSKGPVESEFREYLDEDERVDESMIASSLSPGSSSYPPQQLLPLSLAERLLKLEEVGQSTQLEMKRMKREMKDLKDGEMKIEEELLAAVVRQQEAHSYARAMAEERRHIARERDEVIKEKTATEEQLNLVLVALKIADTERDKYETAYREKLAELRRTKNDHNNTLRMWEEEIDQLRAENMELKRENGFLKETFFTVNPQQEDRLQLKCFSCKQGYSTESGRADDTQAAGYDCAFHPLPPVPPSVWKRWDHGALHGYRRSQYASYFYWSCCNVLAAKDRRPEGCRQGRHHQRWEMDVVMKRVMLSRDVLHEEDQEQELRILGRTN